MTQQSLIILSGNQGIHFSLDDCAIKFEERKSAYVIEVSSHGSSAAIRLNTEDFEEFWVHYNRWSK